MSVNASLLPVKEEFRWSPRKKGKHLINICLHLFLCAGLFCAAPAFANPDGGVVVGGSADIISTPAELQIHQNSDRALIEWSSFDIDQGETTHFYQPGA